MQRKTEGLGQIYTRVMLCGQHIRLDYDKQKQTITCQLKPIINIRWQLQVNTCHTLGAVLVCIRRWRTLLGGFISSWHSINCNFSTAIFSAIDMPNIFALKHLIAVSSRWPRGPLVQLWKMEHFLPNLTFAAVWWVLDTLRKWSKHMLKMAPEQSLSPRAKKSRTFCKF